MCKHNTQFVFNVSITEVRTGDTRVDILPQVCFYVRKEGFGVSSHLKI